MSVALMAGRAIARRPTGSSEWTPAILGASLTAWYDAATTSSVIAGASSATVSQWSDRSGNGRHAVMPLANNQPHSDIRAGWLTFPTLGGTHNFNLPLSGAEINFGSTSRCVASVARVFSGENDNQCLVGPNGNNGFAFFLRAGGGNNCGIAASNTAFFGVGPSVTTDADHVFLGNMSASTWRVSLNGTATSGSHSRTFASGGLSGFIGVENIGAFLNSFDWLYGQIGELVICSALALADQERLEGYLAHRWGLAANLPAGHPYKTARPTV